MGKAWGPDVVSRETIRRGLCLLAAVCLVAGVALSIALSARLLVPADAGLAPAGSHDIITSAPDGASSAAAANDRPTHRSQDRQVPDGHQPAGLEESDDWPAKKYFSGFALLLAPFGVWNEGGGRSPEPAAIEAGSSDSPPQLLQRPPPVR